MGEEPNLEERLSDSASKQTASLSLLEHLKYFMVDGTSSAIFYAPIMTATEYYSGMEAEEIATSRTIGAVTTFLTGYAYNSLLRKRLAKTVGVNTQSSWLKRKVVDISVGMAAMMPFYAPMLYFAGASSKEMAIALFTGSLLGTVAGGMYGSVADKCRIYCGLEPVLNK